MKLLRPTFITLSLIGGIICCHAQNQSIAGGLGLYVFPSGNQDQETQNTDEMTCYKWAKEQSGVDPMNPPKVEAAQVDRSMDGSAVKGAAGGAAAGAAVGAITGDAGDGAAIGAILGGIRGHRAKKARERQQQQANNVGAALTEQEYMNNFKKAFSACMEGKGYTVK